MKRLTTILSLATALLTGCSEGPFIGTEQPDGGYAALALTYTIPDGTVPTRAGYMESTARESAVNDLYLLFFETDTHGNGAYVARAGATLEDATIKKNTVSFTLPGNVQADKDYEVLVVANLIKYSGDNTSAAESYLDDLVAGKTYGQACAELQVPLPVTAGFYDIPGGYLPMSGRTLKRANHPELNVDLLRACVRIDLKLNSLLAGTVTIREAQLRNIAPVAPLFRTQEEISLPRVASALLTVNGNAVTGGLYAMETSMDVNDPGTLLNDAACLLVNLTSTSVHTGPNTAKTWYRINLNVNSHGMQYLKRNNTYTVVIDNVLASGEESPEEAYQSKTVLINEVVITGWEDSGVVPPDVEIS